MMMLRPQVPGFQRSTALKRCKTKTRRERRAAKGRAAIGGGASTYLASSIYAIGRVAEMRKCGELSGEGENKDLGSGALQQRLATRPTLEFSSLLLHGSPNADFALS